jgi:predicted MFS family arabinose efflux permease
MSTRPVQENRSFILILLLAVAIVAAIDRNAMSMLVEPIKHDFGLSDAQVGILLGPAFVVLYALFGIPFGMWADRGNRRNIVGVAITAWSILTMACGAAVGFFSLALARMGVAIGEAGAHPPAYSMISDLYDEEERGTAIGIFSLSSNLGIMIGFAAAGIISVALGWRATFYILGAPGLLLALVFFFFVREPARTHATPRSDDLAAPPLWTTLKVMWRQPSVRHLLFGSALCAFVGIGYSSWIAPYVERTFTDLDRGTIGVSLGIMIGVVGGAGTFLGGYFSDRVAKRDVRWRMYIVCIAIIIGWPIAVVALFMTDFALLLVMMALPVFVVLFHIAGVFALMQQLVLPRMRAVATAVLMLFTNLLGGGMGPYYVGLASDRLGSSTGGEGLGLALASLVFFAFWAAIHFFMVSRHLKEDIEKNAIEALG